MKDWKKYALIVGAGILTSGAVAMMTKEDDSVTDEELAELISDQAEEILDNASA